MKPRSPRYPVGWHREPKHVNRTEREVHDGTPESCDDPRCAHEHHGCQVRYTGHFPECYVHADDDQACPVNRRIPERLERRRRAIETMRELTERTP